MTHTELVQAATDLLFSTAAPENWLSLYDQALASESDQPLTELVRRLNQELHQSHRLAA